MDTILKFVLILMYLDIKMINNKYHTVKTGPKSNKKIVERGNICTPNTQILDPSFHWLDIYTSIKSGVVRIVL